MRKTFITPAIIFLMVSSCENKGTAPSQSEIASLQIKRGEIISCAIGEAKFGSVNFANSCSNKEAFNLAVTLLHSFEYDEAEKAFAKVIDEDPSCAMAYWGIAMSNFHPLWTPPSEAELKKGSKAIEIAQSLNTTRREKDYINAIAAYYADWKTRAHRDGCLAFENAMEKIHDRYPEDMEATVFYALSLDASADPKDKTFAKQKKAGALLSAMYPNHPNHPGIAHYLIHTYDYPQLALMGLDAAKKYASVAPASAHALHMPSHIFTRLGLWNECITSNRASVASAKCYAETAGIKGHWDEELHGLDYLMYAYLQQGRNDSAKAQWDYLKTINIVTPTNFKVAYAFASIPSRFLLENKRWDEAANLKAFVTNIPWSEYPWQKTIIHFTRLIGQIRSNKPDTHKIDLQALQTIHDTLKRRKDTYKATQVEVQIKTCLAWMQWKKGNTIEARTLMTEAADLEDATEKHPVTPAEVLPARELLADMLLEMNDPKAALTAYEMNLKKNPNRFNSLYGAAVAAQQIGDKHKLGMYSQQLRKISAPGSDRKELKEIKKFQGQLQNEKPAFGLNKSL